MTHLPIAPHDNRRASAPARLSAVAVLAVVLASTLATFAGMRDVPSAPAASAPVASARSAAASPIVDQLGGISRAVAVDDAGIVYLGVGPRVVALDVSGGEIVELGRSPVLPGVVNGIAIDGGLAYVAAEASGGLRILDISEPGAITEVGAVAEFWNARGVAVVGELAYIAAADSGLVVVDISDKTAPSVVGMSEPTSWAARVQAHGTNIIVTNSEMEDMPIRCSGLQMPYYGDASVSIIDVSDPSRPRVRSTITTAGGSSAAVAIDERLYVVSATSIEPIGESDQDWMITYDIKDPDSPVELSILRTSWDTCRDLVAVEGGLIAACSGLRTFDLSDPDRPAVRPGTSGGGGNMIAATADGRLMVADDFNGARLLEPSSDSEWVTASGYKPLGGGCGVAIDPTRVAALEVGYDVVSIVRGPDGLSPVARIDTEAEVTDISLVRDLLVTAAQESGDAWLDIYDVSDPSKPRDHSTFGTGLQEASLSIEGERAIVLGLHPVEPLTLASQILDITISDREPPTLRAISGFGACGEHLVSARSMIRNYVASFAGRIVAAMSECGVPILDFTGGSPTVIGEASLWGERLGGHPHFDGETIIVPVGLGGRYGNGIAIIDASEPTHPILRSITRWSIGSPQDGRVVTRIANRVYMVDGRDVVVIDITDEEAPRMIGRLSSPGHSPVAIASDGGRLFVADHRAGIVVFDAQAPLDSVEITPIPSRTPTTAPFATPTLSPESVFQLYVPFATRPG